MRLVSPQRSPRSHGGSCRRPTSDPRDGQEPEQLTDAQLVAVLLDRDETSALATAETLLAGRGLRGLIPLRAVEMRRLGASPAGASRLATAYELARRLAAEPLRDHPIILSSAEILAHYLALHHAPISQEAMGALYLDGRHRLIADREAFRGTRHRVKVDPAPLLKEALLLDAAGVALYHNHPSGDPTPSPHDLAWTHRIKDALDLVGIDLIDHIIVTYQGAWTSLRRQHPW